MNSIFRETFNKQKFYRQKPDNIKHANKQEPTQQMNKKQKAGVLLSSIAGVALPLAIMAKRGKYSLNPIKMFKTPFKNSFLGKIEYDIPNVLIMALGSCIGGYLSGTTLDKNKENKQAKQRESVLQLFNIALPIGATAGGSILGEKAAAKIAKSNLSPKTANILTKTSKVGSPLAALTFGIWAANKIANKVNEKIFNVKNDRPVALTDLSAHVDDICIASQYMVKPPSSETATTVTNTSKFAKFVGKITRIIPLALVVPGYEIGVAKEDRTKEA